MYRVKQIIRESESEKSLDDLINRWIIENYGVKLVDIKYQYNFSTVGYKGYCDTYFHESALIIYRKD